MNSTNTTTIQQLIGRNDLNGGAGANYLSAMTGAQIIYDNSLNSSIALHFSKQIGAAGKKFKILSVVYNAGTDLYDIRGYKMNRKTFAVETKVVKTGVYAEDLQKTCEQLTGLYFTF